MTINMRKWFGRLFRQDFYNSIPAQETEVRHQFLLFRIFTFTLLLCSLYTGWKVFTLSEAGKWLAVALGGLSIITLTCFYGVKSLPKLRRSYFISLTAGCFILHLQAYPAGGVLNSGTIYFCSAIMTAFMLLGGRAGLIFSLTAVSSVLFLQFVAEPQGWVSFALFGSTRDMHQLLLAFRSDTAATFILGIIFVGAYCYYIYGKDNVIIAEIKDQRNELERQNRVLEAYTENLERKNRELDKFASIVSHDLKAPLRAIGNLTGWIEEEGVDNLSPDSKEHFNLIKQRVARMESLINAILDYSRADRREVHDEMVEISQVIKESLELIGKPDHVHVECLSELPAVNGDRTRLDQVFSNLLGNAIRYNDKSQVHIGIRAERSADGWLFSVKDNGPGIDPRFHEKIFVIFQTLHRRDEIESTGVGLAIVKKIIEDQGGSIWVESELGAGAEFRFFWPDERKNPLSLAA